MKENKKDESAAITSSSEAMVPPAVPGGDSSLQVFASQSNFESAQRMAQALAASTIVPVQFQKAKTPEAVANCIIALEMANRIGASPLLVMQNLYVVYGNVGWSSKFLIAALNTCGRFSPLRYEHQNEGDMDNWQCRAWAIDKTTGAPLHGAWVSLKMAKDEGWYSKTGSKWKTMPELMLQYRAAAFFQRAYAPEVSMGMRTVEEYEDIGYNYEDVSPKRGIAVPGSFDVAQLKTAADVNAALLRGHINKEEADNLRDMITRRQVAQDLVAAVAKEEDPAPDTEEGQLFPNNK